MTRRQKQIVLAAIGLVLGGVAAGALALSSHSAGASRSAAVGNRLSPLEAAQIRESRGGKFSQPAADAAMTAHAVTRVGGKEWKIVAYQAKDGKLCAGATWPGEGQAMTCNTKAGWFVHGPLYVEAGAQQDAGQTVTWSRFVLSGMVDTKRVANLRLVNTDCSTSTVAVDAQGFFLDVIEAGSTQGGAWPYKLVARAPNGKAIQTAPVELQAPDTDAAQAAGTTAPTPSSACA